MMVDEDGVITAVNEIAISIAQLFNKRKAKTEVGCGQEFERCLWPQLSGIHL